MLFLICLELLTPSIFKCFIKMSISIPLQTDPLKYNVSIGEKLMLHTLKGLLYNDT
jgi:hypothetical protein